MELLFIFLIHYLNAQKVIFIDFVTTAEECPEIINRAQWGARPALSTEVLAENPAPFVIVHHSATPGCLNKMLCKVRVQNIQEYHMTTRRWDDIGYNFMVRIRSLKSKMVG